MRHKPQWPARLASAALVLLTLGGVAVAAGQQGTQSDPLVTLSYLDQQATPAILAQVDAKITQREADLRAQLSSVVDRYVSQVEGKLGGGGGGTAPAASFTVVTLAQGQRVMGGAGCEFLLRSGGAFCVSDTAPGLIDMTGGDTLYGGGALAANHLYLCTLDGRGVQAQGAVTLLVRGSYTIQ